MPRTDSLDPQSHHNLAGIDLRKNADQNTALDALNVRVDSAQLFVNRFMPKLYKDKSRKYLFACEAHALSGVDYDFDFTYDENPPIVTEFSTSGIPSRLKKNYLCSLSGSGLALVSSLFVMDTANRMTKIGNTDFNFSYYKDKDTSDEFLFLSIIPPSSSKLILISPYGSCSYIVP